uniref:LOW QUALITY PROTEIN: protein furry homolog n=1 Tax=Styela clava TaxID=7725 RepID=UPI001939F9FA|nr:LOW QUALITY PROTEIN: protein furry homolog [Styela clava]
MDGDHTPEKNEANGQSLLSGQFVLHTLIAEFTAQVDKKVDVLLNTHLRGSATGTTWTKDSLMKSLQRGEDPQFDQLLSSLGCVAEYCLPSLLQTLFDWYKYQLPDKKQTTESLLEDKQPKSGSKGKSDSNQLSEDTRDKCRETAVEFVFCLVLIEVLRQIPVHPLPDSQIRYILARAFKSFQVSGQQKFNDTLEIRIVADLYGEAIGVLAQTKFQAVRNKFMYELLKDKDAPTGSTISLIMGMKYFRVKMYPIEDFEASFRFLQELANYSLDIKNREVKHALAGLFVEVLVPVAAAVKTEVNVPVLRDFVDSLYPTSLELSKRQKNKLAMFPLITCLLCVSQKKFFLNNWHIFLDSCLSTLKSRDQKLSRVALESLYRLLWVYMVRIKCESNTITQTRLQSIVKSLFPAGSRNVVPKDTPLNIFVKIIQFIALERLDFAMKEIVLDLLSVSLSGSRTTKPVTLYPERMNIGLRAFLIITDSLQQKDGAPPMPSTINVMPSGNTIRVKKTFINKTLTEDEARTIGVSHYHKHVQRALDGILLALDTQVGVRMMLTNSQLTNKDPQDLLAGEHKPKIELFRTCVAAIPRLMPHGMPHSDLLEMLCRLTVHVDEELRSRAITALQAFAVDFPLLSEEVVASFLSFVLKQVSDIHQVLLDGALKILASLIIAWKNNVTNVESGNGKPASKQKNHIMPKNNNPYAPIINRIEGFAIVLLCSSRSITRKLAGHILKEVRTLARALDYGKRDDRLCLDVLDEFCTEVTEEVLKQQKFVQNFKESDRELITSVASEKELTALVECSSNWHEIDGIHPWILFMTSFVEPSRLPKFCPSALAYSWPDVYIRLSQMQRHLEPIMTTGSKKVASVSVSGDQNLTLWTNYLIFACKSSPSSLFIKQKQSIESAIPAGTPDWKVALIRDVERMDAVPSTLFHRLVAILRAENNNPLYREGAVIGLGHTSVFAFHDLVIEILHLVHEASETKKQENVRRRKKRDNIRIVLVKLFANLASHKVLSEGLLLEGDKLINQKKPKEILQDYIEETSTILETMDKTENAALGTSFSSQQQNLSTTSFGNMLITGQSTDEMRFNFAEMVVQLIRHLPISSRPQMLSNETRKKLFFLFSSWCDKCASAQQESDTDKLGQTSSQLLSMLCAECSVLCCGPVFDEKAFGMEGYLFQWLESLLNCSDPFAHQLGQETIILLLHFNPGMQNLLTWLVGKCYTGSSLIAASCFLGISTIFSSSEYASDPISILNLAMFKAMDSDAQVAQAAEHLLSTLLSRYFPGCEENKKKLESQNRMNSLQRKGRSASVHSLGSHIVHPLRMSEELARSHPELSHAILSELFVRFPSANLVGQRHLLEVMQPWLQNIELVLIDDDSTKVDDPHKSISTQNHPWLPHDGWGSKNATLHVLNNLTYLTSYYHQNLAPELESCWSVLCSTWHGNLLACLQYLMALYSVHTTENLRKAARLAVTYIGRSKGSRVTSILIEECQMADPISLVLDSIETAPYYKIVSLLPRLDASKDSSLKKGSSPEGRKPSLSEGDFQTNEKNTTMPLSVSPDVSSIATSTPARPSSPIVIERKPRSSTTPSHHRLSLQVPISLDRKGNDSMSSSQLSFVEKSKFRVGSGLSKRTPVLSSSLCSLNTVTDSSTPPSAISSPKFSTVSPGRSSDLFTKQSLTETLSAKLPQKFTSAKELRSKSPFEKTDTPLRNSIAIGNTTKFHDSKPNSENFQNQLKEYYDWSVAIQDDLSPRPLPLPSNVVLLPLHTFINCEKIEGLLRSNVACIFLSELVFYRSIDINWQIHLPSVLLSLILNVDQCQLPEVPYYCRRLFANLFIILLPNLIPKEMIGTVLSYSQDSAIHTLSQQSITTYLQPKSNELIYAKAGDDNRYSYTEITSISENGETEPSEHVKTENQLKNLCASHLKNLISATTQLWTYEVVNPKNLFLNSTEQLSAFVQKTIELFEQQIPRLKVRERLGSEASKFAIATYNKHHANRSLQVFRALKLPLSPVFFNKLVRCLLNRIVYGNDQETQSQVIEILVTLLHDCDISLIRKESSSGEASFSNTTAADSSLNSQQSHTLHVHSEQIKKPRSPTPGRLPNYSASPNRSGAAPLSLPSQNATAQPESTIRGRKHAHRRSGSVTLSKKMVVDIMHSSSVPTAGLCHNPTESDVSSANSVSSPPKEAESFQGTKSGNLERKVSAQHSFRRPASTGHSMSMNSETGVGLSCYVRPHSSSKERKMTFAQIFWIGVALLESDYEHEFLIAVQLIEKVLSHLPLQEAESRSLIERYVTQIKWTSFHGIQNMLLKGLTSSVTYNATFNILSSFTTLSNFSLISGKADQGCGFSMNVISLLPHLLDCFNDPDQMCLDAAHNVAQVCLDSFPQKKKLQSLAHVMSLYCNRSYGKPCLTWISVVCKYIHETFPNSIREQLTFLIELLDKGPVSTHLSCLRLICSMLSLSEILLSNSPEEIDFTQSILRTVSKFVNSTKLWKEALNILKLAVSRSSAITTPTASGMLPTSSSLSGDMDRLELPGRTLTFQYNLSNTPIVGRRRTDESMGKRHPHSSSPSYHPSTASSIVTSWKRPHLSQKRTYDSIVCVLPICGKHLQMSHDPTQEEMNQYHQSPDRLMSPTQDEDVDGKSYDSNEDESESDTESDKSGSGIDDIRVLRNFDFLDEELEDNEEGFALLQNQSSTPSGQDNEAGVTEEDPDTYNLTPIANHDMSQDLDQTPTEEDELTSLHSQDDDDYNQTLSLTSGVLSQSWSGTRSIFTDVETTDTHSSMIMISSIAESEKQRKKNTPQSSVESINIADSPQLSQKTHSRSLTQSESAIHPKSNLSSSESMKTSEFEKSTNDQENTSESLSNLDELENDLTNNSPISSSEELQLEMDKTDTLISSLTNLGTPPPPTISSLSLQSLPHSDDTLVQIDIPIVEPPPTSDITSNLTAIRFDSPSHFLSQLTDSPVKTLQLPNEVSTSFKVKDGTAYHDTTYTTWKLHIASMATYNDSAFISKTFDLFPMLFKVLCIDFSNLSKDGCKHLGGQLSRIAEHFSSMVEQLPSQIKCPICLATKSAIEPVVEQMKFGVSELQDHLDSYNAKQKAASECMDLIKSLENGNTKQINTKSQGIEYKQLELCRMLYKLHFQLLLLLKSFNKLINLVSLSTVETKNITEQLGMLKKKILVVEKTFQAHRDKTDIEMLHDLKSMTVEEAEQVLQSSISSEQVHLAIRQLFLLRTLWKPEAFGVIDEPAADILIKIYFKHLEDKSSEKFFAIIGPENSSHNMCEKLMMVNSEIQQSLDSLAVNAGDIDKSSTTKKTHL